MTQILTIARNAEGQFEIVNTAGKVVEGPFETDATAWRALGRLDNEAAQSACTSKPESKSKTQNRKEKRRQHQQSEKMTPKQEQRMKLAAGKAPGWVRTLAATKFDPEANRKHRNKQLGTFGAASEVKRIDPAQYLAEKAARGER